MKTALLRTVFALAAALLFFEKTAAQCGATVDAGPDKHHCEGETVEPQLYGSVGGDYYWFGWTPAAGLSSTTIPNPHALNVTSSRKYSLRADGWGTENLLTNGSFENGTTGYYTELPYTPGPITTQNTYTLSTAASTANPSFGDCYDHTSGSGNMFLFNTGVSPQTLRLDVPNVLNKSIRLRFWKMNPLFDKPNNCSLGVFINSVQMPSIAFNGPPCEWQMVEMTIYSVYPTMAIQFFPGVPGFGALDDFEVVSTCTVTDTVQVIYHKKVTNNISARICDGDFVQVGNDLFGDQGIYNVPLTTEYGCDSTVILNLQTVKLPTYIAPQDPAFNCITPYTLLSAPNPGAYPPVTTLKWTATDGGVIIGNPNASSIYAGAPGTYKLNITHNSPGLMCADSTFVEVTGPVDLPVAEAGPPKFIGCGSPTATLAGSYTGGTNFYPQWSTPNGQIVSGPNTLNPVVGAGGMYILTVTNFANGCTDADTVNVSLNTDVPLANAGPPFMLNCATLSDTLTGTAATGPNFEFSWSTPDGHFVSGQNTLLPVIDQPGQYFLTVLNKGNGCSGVSSVVIARDTTKPNAQIGQPFTLDCDQPQRALFGNSSSGFSPVWTTTGGHFVSGQNTFSPIVDEAGTYFLNITNPQNHCSTTLSVQISKNTVLPVVSAGPTVSISCKTPVAPLLGSFSSGGPAPSIVWTTANGNITAGQGSLNPSISAVGEYVLTVKNTENGCSASSQTTVVGDFAPPPASIAPHGRLNCFTVAIPITANAGSFTYQWSTDDGLILSGQNSATAIVGKTGIYDVVVTNNSNGCTATTSTLVEKNEPPKASIIVSQNIACFGQSNGTAIATAELGAGSFNFTWSTGQTGLVITGLPAGPVTVTVTDADGCTATASKVLTQPTQLAATCVSTPADNPPANNGTAAASATGGTAPMTFKWSNGQTDQAITGLTPGAYSVVVTDANGCTATASVTVGGTTPCQVALTGSAQNTLCHGSSDGSVAVNLLNESAPTTYSWSNGGAGAQLTGLAAGSFSVTATDAAGCSATGSFTVGEPLLLEAFETHQNVQCPADLTGSALASASGGTPGYSFVWEDGSIGALRTGLAAGNYSATATDANGCTATVSVEIKSADLIAPVLKLKPLTVPIDANGKATLTAQNFDNGSTDNCGIVSWAVSPPEFDCSQLGAHDVTITATDGAGNVSSKTATALIVDNTPPDLTCPADKTAWWCSPVVSFPLPVALDNCLDNGGQFEFVSGQQSGTAFPPGVTVNIWKFTDGSGNSSSCSFTVTIFGKPGVNVAEVQPSCHGLCDGSLTASVTGGAGPFSYTWEMLQTTPQIVNVCAGPHALSVIDGGGCEVAELVDLGEPAALGLSNPLVVNDLNGSGIGAISLSVGGGTTPLAFEWKKDGQFFSSNQNLTGLKTGSYQLLVTDANGCTLLSQVFFVDNVVSAGEPNWATGMLLLPNPTLDRARLVFAEPVSDVLRVEMFDATGRLIELRPLDGPQKEVEFDLTERPAGAYQLRVTAGGSAVVRVLIKQ